MDRIKPEKPEDTRAERKTILIHFMKFEISSTMTELHGKKTLHGRTPGELRCHHHGHFLLHHARALQRNERKVEATLAVFISSAELESDCSLTLLVVWIWKLEREALRVKIRDTFTRTRTLTTTTEPRTRHPPFSRCTSASNVQTRHASPITTPNQPNHHRLPTTLANPPTSLPTTTFSPMARRRRPPRAGALTELPPLKIAGQIATLQALYYTAALVLMLFTALVAGSGFSLGLLFGWEGVRGDTTNGWLQAFVWVLDGGLCM
ncbi:hypothetical protein G7046_g1727 [Stylonectria norvegica]|nr:hypothetical protein G7046_g1727 [Stylonectria norvegica]